jgi:hypothetical protein
MLPQGRDAMTLAARDFPMTRFNPLHPHAQPKAVLPKALRKGEIPSPAPVGRAPILKENHHKNRLELYFPRRPRPLLVGILDSTKGLPFQEQWHFHWRRKFWYAQSNDVNLQFARILIARVLSSQEQ